MKIHGSSNLWDATLLYSRVASHKLELLAAVKVLPNTITMVKLINRSALAKGLYGLWMVFMVSCSSMWEATFLYSKVASHRFELLTNKS